MRRSCISCCRAAGRKRGDGMSDVIKDVLMGKLFGTSGTSSGGGVWVQSGTFVCETQLSHSEKGAPVDDSNGEPDMLFIFRDSEESVKGLGIQETIVEANFHGVDDSVLMYGAPYTSSNPSISQVYLPFVIDGERKPHKLSNGEYCVTSPSSMIGSAFIAGIRYRWLAIGGVSA